LDLTKDPVCEKVNLIGDETGTVYILYISDTRMPQTEWLKGTEISFFIF
jgi:hypothetical protein